MPTWYERNKEKAISAAKQWRINNLDAYQAYQREYARRKRAEKRQEELSRRFKPAQSPENE